MKKIAALKIKQNDKFIYCTYDDLTLNSGSHVICKTQNGLELAKVVIPLIDEQKRTLPSSLGAIIRIASKRDIAINKKIEKEQIKYFPQVLEAIKRQKLNIKLISIYKTFDGNKMTFYFSSDERVDFRDLVKDLASMFHKKIEMRQIGVRDESRILGGLGICGRPLCCSQYLKNFNPVSVKMAKDQGINVGPSKLAGCCSRLMCCIKYEQSTYDELMKECPKIGSKVTTEDGNGVVLDGNPLTGFYRVHLDENPDAAPKLYHKDNMKFEVLKCHLKNEDIQNKETSSSKEPSDSNKQNNKTDKDLNKTTNKSDKNIKKSK